MMSTKPRPTPASHLESPVAHDALPCCKRPTRFPIKPLEQTELYQRACPDCKVNWRVRRITLEDNGSSGRMDSLTWETTRLCHTLPGTRLRKVQDDG